MTTAHATSPIEEATFEVKANEVMRELRASLLSLIESLPMPIRRAADLERALSLSTTLAWQVHRLATMPNPIASAADVPGAGAAKQVLNAARSHGVSEEVLDRVVRALKAFEGMVRRHAGDRATFATMINGLASGEGDVIDVKVRRQAFRIQSQIWGVQVKTIHSVGMYHPGANSDVFDVASIRGLAGIRRLRHGTAFRLTSQLLTDGQYQGTQPQPLGEPAPDSRGPSLLLDYCTQPHPELVNHYDNNCVHTYLRDTPIGNAGAQTAYVGDITRNIAWATPGGVNNHIVYYAIMKPAELIVKDILIHKDMFGPLSPSIKIFGSLDRLGEPNPEAFSADETLPMRAEVHHLGEGPSVLPTPHIPRYPEMIESVARTVGWDPECFSVFRCIIEYPLLSSVVSVRFALPEKGNW